MDIWFSFEFLFVFTLLTWWITLMGFYIGKNARQNESILNDALCKQLETMLVNWQYQKTVHWTWRTVGWGERREGTTTKGHKGILGKAGMFIISMWQWFHRCIRLSKHIKLYSLKYISLSNTVYFTCISMTLFKKKNKNRNLFLNLHL